ncbi:MAG: M1 family metallopeptidase [archaeon]|nr:MAG: M1 family metallopeptidase [archaeon]
MEGAYKSFRLPESTLHYPASREFRTEHVKIELDVDFKGKKISGSCSLTVSPIAEELRTVKLDARSMTITGVTLGDSDLKFEHNGEVLAVHLPSPVTSRTTIKVDYWAIPSEGVYFTGPDVEHPEKEVQAWTHNESEFARYWFPCFDHPNERSSSEIVVRVPRGFRVVSNGRLVSMTEDGESSTFHWLEETPHPTYLTSFVAGRLGEITDEVDGIKLGYYFPESKRADALRYFGETPAMMEAFKALTGMKYPYPKYSQTVVEDFIYGGMENFNATTLAMNYFPEADSEEDFSTSYGAPQTNAVNLVAHELAHQWFGDYVTCVDWSHAWLNEGFATYFQGLYLEKTRGVDAFRWDLWARAEEYFEEDEKRYRRPIVDREYVYHDDVFDHTTYQKGEWMLHELRYLIGDRAFFAGITEHLRSNALGNVDTHDLRKAMEKTSGVSLEEFFEQAFFSPGFPELEVAYDWDEGSKVATVTMKQVQKLEMGTPRFKLPLEVVFYVGGKRASTRVWLRTEEQSFSFGLASRPNIVEVDPQRWILKKVAFKKGIDLLVAQLRGSEDASSREDAAGSIGAVKADSAIPALIEAATKEQFWAVRSASIRALGVIGSESALVALLGLGLPQHRRVRRAVAEALGHFTADKAKETLSGLLKGDPSPYVRCEAALSLSKVWKDGALPILKEAMKVHTTNLVLSEACLHAIGGVEGREASETILENLRYGKPTRARIGALKGIKSRGVALQEEVKVLKEVLLRDKEFRVRQYLSSEVMPALADRRFLGALKESSEGDKDPRIRRTSLEAYYQILN